MEMLFLVRRHMEMLAYWYIVRIHTGIYIYACTFEIIYVYTCTYRLVLKKVELLLLYVHAFMHNIIQYYVKKNVYFH